LLKSGEDGDRIREQERINERERMQKEIELITAEGKELRLVNAELQRQVAVSEEKLSASRSREDDLAGEKEQCSQYICELERGIRASETAKSALSEERLRLVSRSESLEKSVAEMQAQMHAFGEQITCSSFTVRVCHNVVDAVSNRSLWLCRSSARRKSSPPQEAEGR